MEPIDLTLEISNKLPSFPGSPRPQFISWADKKSDGYNLELIFLSSHSGTHLDAPYHFIEKGLKIDKIPLNRLITNAFLCKIRKGPDEPITKNDIARFEAKNGKIPQNSAIIFGTGWSKNTSRKDYFARNPGLSAGAASYLSERKPSLIGIDSPSIDLGKDPKFSVHHLLLKKDVLILENLCNLDKIKKVSFRLIVLPLKLKDATGSPVRAVAV
ncbi:MAG TPA: cyclase family protein [Candidatus Nitrosotalea sp.]|nr:cyclase family protein [Nitrososphaerota archaeon]HKU32318.1 cyclase family protein [Candidatus Nitrosotalea sp.]